MTTNNDNNDNNDDDDNDWTLTKTKCMTFNMWVAKYMRKFNAREYNNDNMVMMMVMMENCMRTWMITMTMTMMLGFWTMVMRTAMLWWL